MEAAKEWREGDAKAGRARRDGPSGDLAVCGSGKRGAGIPQSSDEMTAAVHAVGGGGRGREDAGRQAGAGGVSTARREIQHGSL